MNKKQIRYELSLKELLRRIEWIESRLTHYEYKLNNLSREYLNEKAKNAKSL